MRIKLAAVAATLTAALGASALLAGVAAAHAHHHHAAPAHRKHRRHRRTTQPPATVRAQAGGTLHDPVWGHQGKLLTARPNASLRPDAVIGNDPNDPDDPITSGCWDANAYIANSSSFGPAGQAPWGYVANWYSPDCGTNWAEAVWTSDPPAVLGRLHVYIVDDVTGENHYFEEANSEIYTDMTHSEFDRACAVGGIETEPGMHYESSLACA